MDNCNNVQTPGAGNIFRIDAVAPTSTIEFPIDGLTYKASSYDAGCGTGSGDICGTASDTGSGVSAVQLSVEDNGNGKDWQNNSQCFNKAHEFLVPATGTTSWSLGVNSSCLTANHSYTIHSIATDAAGNAETGPTTTFNFVAATVDTTAPTISAVSDSPDPFTPNGDSLSDT